MAGWADLPAELLQKVALTPAVASMLRGVCKAWKEGLESAATTLQINGASAKLPLNLAARFPSLSALHLESCHRIPPVALRNLEPLPLASLTLSIPITTVNKEGADALMALGLAHLHLMSPVNPSSSDSVQLADDHLWLLEGLPIRTMMLGYAYVSNFGVAALRGMPIAKLDLSNCSITDTGLLAGLRGMPLSQLSLAGNRKITDAGLAVLRGMPISDLDLSGCRNVFGDDLEPLSGMPLTRLNLAGISRDGDDGGDHYFTGTGLGALRGAPLTYLNLADNSQVMDEGIEKLRGLPLTELNLYACSEGITGTGLEALRGMPLTSLNLWSCHQLTDIGLDHIAGLPLTFLDLGFAGSTFGLSAEAVIECLLSLPDLVEFDFDDVFSINEEEMRYFWKARLLKERERFLAEKSRREVIEARLKVLEG